MQDQTGVTWNKRFKKQYGPLNKVCNLMPAFTIVDQIDTIIILNASISQIIHIFAKNS